MSEIKLKFFIGCLITSELKMYLKQNSEWKNAVISSEDLHELKETHFEGKDYVGRFYETPLLSLPFLFQEQEDIRKSLFKFCPKMNFENLKLSIFSQIFIS